MKEIEKYKCPFCHYSFKECKNAYHGLCMTDKCSCFSKIKYKNYSMYNCSTPEIIINSLNVNRLFYIKIDFYKEITFLSDSNLKFYKLNYVIDPSLIDTELKIKALINNLIFI